jgi:23S rRNA (adenine2503-C2)-methyltransferase
VPSDIKSFTQEELQARFAAWRQPAYRVGQLLEWLYARRVTTWAAMTNLPKALRERLAAEFTLQPLVLVRKQGARLRSDEAASAAQARDTTQKFLWQLADGALIESVLIPANPALYGEASDRHTLCVSTQVGCAYGCKFCASGLDGWKRNLAPHEIVEQVLATERWSATESCKLPVDGDKTEPRDPATGSPQPVTSPRLVNNLVVMGMGEPLANYENLLKALRLLNAPWGGGIGARKITISTSGLAPQIRRLADEPEQFRLAVSLHGATNAVRDRIMPVNKKYPLRELTAALDYYQSKRDRLITFEYILIAGVNDSLEQTRPLAALVRKLHAKVNLIPYNTVEGLSWNRPDDRACEAFLAALEKLGVTATLRREKGGDIDAACGQLRLKTERELASA